MPTTPSSTSKQRSFEHGLREHLAATERTRSAVPDVEHVRAGLALGVLDDVKDAIGLSWDDLETVLGVSARTLQRRRRCSEDLTPSESDRLWRLLHMWGRATEVFGSERAAREWLTRPHGLLGEEPPLRRLDTEPGMREVEDMLTVIDETAAA